MNKKIMAVLIFLNLTVINVSSQEPDENEVLGYLNKEQKYQVSIYTIAGNPSAFDNKPVYIKGYIKFWFGEVYIYPDRSSCKDAFHENGIAVGLTVSQYDTYVSAFEDCEIDPIFGIYQKLNQYSEDDFQNLSLGLLAGDIKFYKEIKKE